MIRENLPSIPGPRYSKEIIDVFNTLRKRYLDSARVLKSIISRTEIGFDPNLCCDSIIEKLEEEERLQKQPKLPKQGKHFEDLYVNDIMRCLTSLAYGSTASRRLGLLKNGIIGRLSDDIITAFYIPEDMDWITVTLDCKFIRISSTYFSSQRDRDILDDDLELLLERSKIIPLPEGQEHLENILKRSQNPLIRHDNCGEETIDIDGIKYKRVVLFHPALPIISFIWFIVTYTTSDDRPIYSENLVVECSIRRKIALREYDSSITINFCENISYENIDNNGEIIRTYPDNSRELLNCQSLSSRPGLIIYCSGLPGVIVS